MHSQISEKVWIFLIEKNDSIATAIFFSIFRTAIFMKILNENQRSTIFILYIFTELYEMKMLLKCSNLKLGLEALILGVEKNCSFRIKKNNKNKLKKDAKRI